MHKKVIICDLDGTLMNDERTIPEKNIQMIEDLWKAMPLVWLVGGHLMN